MVNNRPVDVDRSGFCSATADARIPLNADMWRRCWCYECVSEAGIQGEYSRQSVGYRVDLAENDRMLPSHVVDEVRRDRCVGVFLGTMARRWAPLSDWLWRCGRPHLSPGCAAPISPIKMVTRVDPDAANATKSRLRRPHLPRRKGLCRVIRARVAYGRGRRGHGREGTDLLSG